MTYSFALPMSRVLMLNEKVGLNIHVEVTAVKGRLSLGSQVKQSSKARLFGDQVTLQPLSIWVRPVMKPWEGSSGVEGVLSGWKSPVARFRRTMLVKVPHVDCRGVVIYMLDASLIDHRRSVSGDGGCRDEPPGVSVHVGPAWHLFLSHAV